MKKSIFFLIVAMLVAPSCVKKNDFLSLVSRVDKIENDRLATIDEQIKSISGSITDLVRVDSELKNYIIDLTVAQSSLQTALAETNSNLAQTKQELEAADNTLTQELAIAKADVIAQLEAAKAEIESNLQIINNTLENLQAKDTEIETKINQLKEYTNSLNTNTRNWATATFATLEQFAALSNEIAAIKVAIETINTNIVNLENRLNNKISTEIANAANSLDAKLQQRVEEITTAYQQAISQAKAEITAAYTTSISSAITSLETSMKQWINEQLTKYYTIEETNARIAATQTTLETQLKTQKAYLEGLISSLNVTLSTNITENTDSIVALKTRVTAELQKNAEAIAKNAQDIAKLQQSLENTKGEITAAYQQAIQDAISNVAINNEIATALNARLTSEVATINSRIDTEIAAINEKITALTARVTQLEEDVTAIKSTLTSLQEQIDEINKQLDELFSQIQSVVFVPEYSDGKATVYWDGVSASTSYEIAEFRITPIECTEKLVKAFQQNNTIIQMDAIEVQTRSSRFIDMPILEVTLKEPGLISVKSSTSNLSNEFFYRGQEVMSSLSLNYNATNITSGYYELIYAFISIPYPEFGNSIPILGDWDNDAATPSTLLHWAPVNCGYEEVGEINTQNDHRLGKLYQWGAGDGKANLYGGKALYYDDAKPSNWQQTLSGSTTDKWNNNQGPCPDGWRLPTSKEFKILCAGKNGDYGWIAAGSTNKYAGQLNIYAGAEFFGENTLKTPRIGVFFPAAGYRFTDGSVYGMGSDGCYWSSTPSYANYAYNLNFNSSSLSPQNSNGRAYGRSVRCVADPQ